MKRIVLALVAGSLFCLVSAQGAWALSWKDVASLHQDGVADSLIIQKIIYSGQVFQLEAKDIRDLKKAGVSDEVISVMLRTEAQGEGDNGGYAESGDYHGDTSSHVYVGLGFGYYGGYYGPYYGGYAPYPYYGGYYGRYYAPYYRSHYYPRYRTGYYGRPGYNYGYARPRSNGNYGNARPRYNYGPRPGSGHPSSGSPGMRHR